MSRLFGTDGVRGIANSELTPALAMDLGRTLVRVLRESSGEPRRGLILVGRDTRRSGEMLEAAFTAGVCAAGWDVKSAGVAPTPALAYGVRSEGARAAAVISASHNPPEYNGIKFFGSDGFKLPDEMEDNIETLLGQAAGWGTGGNPGGGSGAVPTGGDVGRIYPPAGGADLPGAGGSSAPGGEGAAAGIAPSYYRFLLERLGEAARGMDIVLDCANGAAYQLAPRVFRDGGARVTALNTDPDGLNINVGCGSTHPEAAAREVVRRGARAGFTFDGDADRCFAIDETGAIIDGDTILTMAALHRLKEGRLQGDAIAATVMSNLGLDRALGHAGGSVIRTAVGDRHVVAAMREHGLVMGGEQSGHLVFMDAGQTTGDGLLAAIEMVRIMADTGEPLSQLAAAMQPFPQVHRNVSARNPGALARHPAVEEAFQRARERLEPEGRVLLRPSGTEPVVRIMAEGPEEGLIEEVAAEVARAAEQVEPEI